MKTDSFFKLGIQSYCLKEVLDFSDIIDILKKVGLGFLEIYPGHLSFKDDIKKKKSAFKIFKDNNIKISAYGCEFFNNDINKNSKIFKFANSYEIGLISAIIEPDSMKLVDSLAKEYNIKLAIHNHGFDYPYSQIEDFKKLFSETSEHIGICLDTAHLFEVNEDPVNAVKVLKDRLYGVHLKEFEFDKNGNIVFNSNGLAKDKVIGSEKLDLIKFLQILKNQDFRGFMSLEFEDVGPEKDHVSKIKENVKAFNNAYKQLK